MGLTPEMIEGIPRLPGVYILKDTRGRTVYVGKAKDLRSRLRSYLAGDGRPYTPRIVAETNEVDFIITRNETEALLLENQLIKDRRPRYNIELKDDKSYVRIRVSLSHPWPSIGITRIVKDDGSVYFGPYPSAQATRHTLSVLGRIFPLRRCKDTEFSQRTRPCLYHSIGLCLAPCVRPHVKDEYAQAVQDLVAFLEGKNTELLARLRRRMEEASERLAFEEAARIRDRIASIETTLVPQAIVGSSRADSNVFAFFESAHRITASVLRIKGGALSDMRSFSLPKAAQEDAVTMIILQYYLAGNDIPPRIYTDIASSSRKALEEALWALKGSRVNVTSPTKGRPLELLQIARDNAQSHAGDRGPSALEEIARVFHLSSLPYRMECYDVSTFHGTDSTASCAVFVAGEPAKDLYRRYRIRGVTAMDDFAMLKEVFQRRFSSSDPVPDLVVIDGGKAQLGVFLRVIKELGRPQVPVVSIAKARTGRPDRFFLPGRKDAVRLPRGSRALAILQRLRDEAHRFAVGYHRLLRSRHVRSPFEEIPGIGRKKARELLKLTSKVEDVTSITRDDLASLKCLTRTDIERVLASFRQGSTQRANGETQRRDTGGSFSNEP